MTLVQQIAQYVRENGGAKIKEIADVFGLSLGEAQQFSYLLK